MDVNACASVLRSRSSDVIDLPAFFGQLEAASATPIPNIREQVERLLFFLGGERHIELRRASLAFFRPSILAMWQPQIARCAEDAVALLDGRTEADLVADFARIVAGDVVCRMIGLPAAGREDFDLWTDEARWLTEPLPPMRRLPRIETALGEFAAAVADAACASPPPESEGLPTFLHQNDDGLSAEDRIWLAMSLYGASSVTRHTLSNTIMTVASLPPERRSALLEPERRMAAVERLIAASTSFQFLIRERRGEAGPAARVEVPIGPASAEALGGACPLGGASVAGSINHVAFGAGVHKCLGAELARLIIAEALTALVRRFPRFAPLWPPSGFEPYVMVTSPIDFVCRLT
jgi:cytochrome P450